MNPVISAIILFVLNFQRYINLVFLKYSLPMNGYVFYYLLAKWSIKL